MQLQCQYCHKPFAIGKEMVHAALDMLAAENLHHYDAHCPHCRRSTQVGKDRLLRAAPDWGKPKQEEPASE